MQREHTLLYVFPLIQIQSKLFMSLSILVVMVVFCSKTLLLMASRLFEKKQFSAQFFALGRFNDVQLYLLAIMYVVTKISR